VISLYIAQPSWLHRLPAGLKLLVLLVASLALLPVSNPWALTWGCAVAVGVYASLGRAGVERLIGLRSILLLVLGLGLFQALVMNWHVAWLSVARLIVMIMIADLVSATTPMQDMMRVIRPCLTPLRLFGLNPDRLSLAVALVIRFIPSLLAQWQAQSAAWRARTNKSAGVRLLVPFMSLTMSRTEKIAEALIARKSSRGN
jgi:biotin transport system permease protein